MKRTVTVLGGDLRQVHLARLLAEDGWSVSTWGLDLGGGADSVPLHKALGSEVVILPLPVSKGGKLYLPLTDSVLETEELWPRLHADQLLLGGMTGPLSRKLYLGHGLTLLDYYQREEVQILNAVPTAEGAIQRAMEITETTMRSAKCLVIGYGRIGKVLAHRLQAMGAEVTVAARKYSDLAWIDAFGFSGLLTGDLAGHLGSFTLIFNTVPSLVLDAPLLAEISPECALLELASAPGGIDRTAAEKLARRVIDAPGLPGIVAPRTAAAAIRQGIYHILEERGESF